MSAVRRLSVALANAMKRTDSTNSVPSATMMRPNSPSSDETPPSAGTGTSASFVEGDSTAIVEDDDFDTLSGKRIREVRRSWPQTPQEVEYRYGIQVRGKQVVEEGELGAKVKTLEQSFGSEVGYIEHSSSTYELHLKQLINWEHLPEDKVAKLDYSTVWNGGSGLFDIEQNDAELQRIASLFHTAKSTRISIIGGKGLKESVLEHKRSTAVSVAMKRMRLQPSKFGKLAWALRDMNEAYLTPTAVDIMKKSQMWATPKEIDDMKARVRDGRDLADPDALLWFLATSVPDTAARVSALAFRYEFDDILGEMIRATSLIKAASLEICTSELLKRLMRVILLVGNNINETFGGAPAWGITVASLSKLSTIKTTDKSLSILDCIISYLDQMAPETFEVVDDCTCTPSASKYSIAIETKVLKDARRGLETVRKIKTMEKFYLSACKKLDDIDREMRQAREAFDKCLDHFCVPRGSMDTNEFFGVMSEFFDTFEKAVAAHDARQRLAAHPPVKSGLLNPSFMKQRRETSQSISSATGATTYTPKKNSVYTPRPSIFGRMRPGKD